MATRHRLGPRFIGPGAAVLLALPVLAPVLVVLTAPWHAEAKEWDHVWRTVLPAHTAETLLLLVGTVGLATALGTGCAWLVAAFDFPGRRLFRWALVLPLAVPTYISAITYAALLGPTGSISLRVHGATGWRPDIVDLPGLCAVLGLVLYPYIYLPARAVFTGGLRDALDAARLLGAHGMRRFGAVAVPLARPAIAGGALLVAMETLNDYGAVKYYGIRTLTTAIFQSWGGLYDLGSALRIGGLLVGLVALLLMLERRSRRHRRQATDGPALRRTPLRGTRGWVAAAACGVVLALGFVLPAAKLLVDAWSVLPRWEAATDLMALGHTVGVATGAAVATLLLALLLLFAWRHGRGPWVRALVQASGLGYAIPGAVIAVGVMTAAGVIDRALGLPFTLIGSIGVLAYAFAVRFLAVALQPVQGGLARQSTAQDEAARLLGASPLRTFLRINLPPLRPVLWAALVLVAIDVIKELPLTLILRPFDFDTLSTRVFEQARIEALEAAAPPALLIVLCGLVPVLVVDRLAERRTQR